ncbi:hypothetical protein SprV_0702288500 [Sparganum proliferum]
MAANTTKFEVVACLHLSKCACSFLPFWLSPWLPWLRSKSTPSVPCVPVVPRKSSVKFASDCANVSLTTSTTSRLNELARYLPSSVILWSNLAFTLSI